MHVGHSLKQRSIQLIGKFSDVVLSLDEVLCGLHQTCGDIVAKNKDFYVDFNFLDCPLHPIVNEDGILIETKCQAYVFECREHMF